MPSKTRKARKAPAESATLFPIETVKTGLDGKEWIVALKGRSQRWMPYQKELVLFATYKMGTGGSWTYRLPKGWEWIGSGSTMTPAYPNEEQFQGSPQTAAVAKAYLTKFFADLKKKGIVEQFKIKSSL